MRIGVDLGGTKIEARRPRRGRRELRAPARRDAARRLRRDARSAIAHARRRLSSARPARPGTVGVGMPGTLSPATGLVKNANSTWLNGRPLDRDLASALGRAGALRQRRQLLRALRGHGRRGRGARASCSASSSAPAPAAASSWTAACSTGPERDRRRVGAQSRCRGRSDDERPGPPCYCGKSGCIETFLSGPGLARDHEQATGERARRRPTSPSAPRAATPPRRAPSRATRTAWRAAWRR